VAAEPRDGAAAVITLDAVTVGERSRSNPVFVMLPAVEAARNAA
jgi:hypothetical protein